MGGGPPARPVTVRENPEQDQESLRQLNLIYSALIGIGGSWRLERDRLTAPQDGEEPGDPEA